MTKRLAINLVIVLVFLAAFTLIMYFFFPKIWGDILFPLDYKEYIVKYSKEYNLDPTFVSAVIYSESHFSADAVSRAGARGLMQIMPATGSSIASRLGDDSYTADKLFDPETNIRYGCWYLRYLLDNYQEDSSAALAGYNGGGAVGDRYVVSREAGIPTETQNYIQAVLSTQEMYKKLYSEELNTAMTAATPSTQPDINVAEQLKVQTTKTSTFTEKIIDFFRKMLYGQ